LSAACAWVIMRIVIQCAGKKHKSAGWLKDASGERVIFVAHPEKCSMTESSLRCCRPDDEASTGLGTWREYLTRYNQQNLKPDGLFRAAELYKPTVYRALVERYGWRNVFILSAGWGLIRSDFLTPYYDITFSNQGDPWSKGRTSGRFQDFSHLRDSGISPDETIYFFGGKDYLPLYYFLTQNIAARKVIYHSQDSPSRRQGYEYIRYRRFTNWHYTCAQDFMEDSVPK
jgi:hypothetical protein